MPADALLVTVIVVAIFVAFAVALAWADRQTGAGGSIRIPGSEASSGLGPSPARQGRYLPRRPLALGSVSTQSRFA